MGSNIVTIAVFDIFYVKKYDLGFRHLTVIRGQLKFYIVRTN